MKNHFAGERLYHHRVPWKATFLTVLYDPAQWPRVRAILLPGPAGELAGRQTLAGDPPPVAEKIRAYLAGEQPAFSLADLDLTLLAPFETVVTRVVFAIPHGEVRTYGEVAREANNPGAARAVGQVMANNRFPLVVPCHRVVRADHNLGGFGGGAPMKKELLALEGVAVNDRFYLAR